MFKKMLKKIREKKGSVTLEQILWIVITVAVAGAGITYLVKTINGAKASGDSYASGINSLA